MVQKPRCNYHERSRVRAVKGPVRPQAVHQKPVLSAVGMDNSVINKASSPLPARVVDVEERVR